MLKWGVFSCGGVLASFVLGLPYGPTGVAIAYVAGNYILAWPVTSYAVAGTSISTKAFWGVMVKPFLATVVATTIAVATRWMMLSMGAGNWFAIAAAWVCLAGVYVLVTFYFFGMWMEYASLRAHLWKAPAAITPSDPAPSEPSPVT
jgi:PST family polysaccharide transporter